MGGVWGASPAISFPRASSVLSTCLASTATSARSVNSSLPSWKLTRAPTVPIMCVSAGESRYFYAQVLIARTLAVAAGDE